MAGSASRLCPMLAPLTDIDSFANVHFAPTAVVIRPSNVMER